MAEGNVTQFTFDVDADRAATKAAADMDKNRLNEMVKDLGREPDLNPVVHEKLMRDEEFAKAAAEEAGDQPEPPEVTQQKQQKVQQSERESKLYQLGAELDKWKAIAKRRKEDQTALEGRLRQLETRVNQNQPVADVRQLTGKNPDDILTAQEVHNLLMGLAGAFGQQIQGLRAEAAQFLEKRQSAVSDVDEAELTYMHPWLEQLPVAQRERAMLDMIATRNAPEPEPTPKPTPRQTEQGRSQIRESNFIETSNRSSRPETVMQDPQVVARNEKLAKLQELLSKPGGSSSAGELLAELGAGNNEYADTAYQSRRR